MSRKRLGRLQRTATIVPLALLSAAWTASVAGVGGIGAPIAAGEPNGTDTLPDGTTVPTEAIEAPASVSDADDLAGGDGNTQDIVATAATNAIPSAALAAYQRAETVINAADKTCNLTWQLVAAIGRVESDHGRFEGNVLDDDGVANPGIYGVALNGRGGTQAIDDTDAGQYDGDTAWDRAIGPMQFIPSTWSVVGVDADGDGERNPQDIDDAALATAVYLCSGKDDLSTTSGQRAAVYRYNHSQSYVDLVLSIMEAYLDGEFTTVPNNTVEAGYFVPEPENEYGSGNPQAYAPASPPPAPEGGDTGGGDTFTDDTDDTDDGDGGTTTPPPPPPPGGGGGDGGDDPTNPNGNNVPDTGNPNVDEPVEDLIDGLLGPLTQVQAQIRCGLRFPLPTQAAQKQECLESYGL